MSEAVEGADSEVRDDYKRVQLGPKTVTIPEPWDVLQIDEIAAVEYGKSLPDVEGGVPAIGSSGIFDWVGESLVENETIVVGRKGSAGEAYLLEQSSWPSDTAFYLDEFDHAEMNIGFLYYYMQFYSLSGELEQTTLPSLDRSRLETYRVTTPSLSEQHRIAGVLSTVDEQIQQTEAIIGKTAKLKRGLVQDLYSEGYYQYESLQETTGGSFPTSWKYVRIGKYAEVISGTHVKSDLVTRNPDLTPYLTGPADFDGNRFRVTKYTDSPKAFCESGDVLVTVKGMGCGQSAMADSHVSISRQLKAIRPEEELSQRFLFYWIRHKEDQLNTLAQGTRQPGLSVADIETFPLPLPSFGEQEKIAESVGNIDIKIEQETERLEHLRDLKRGLMQDLLTGTVRAPESIEVEDRADARR